MFAAARAVLDRRLDRDAERPVLVACSGGGDSTALLLAARVWAASAGRRLVIATVDHGLQPQAADWAASVARRCGEAGEPHLNLRWKGPYPASGLSAAAREARHRVLAQAARDAGARVVLLGHTADDVLEAQLMRRWGSTVPSPREWSPSPAWPEGRGVFLLRPLLGLRRHDIRETLARLGESWIEDPANVSRLSLRARARAEIVEEGAQGLDPEPPAPGLAPFEEGPGGELVADRRDLTNAPAATSRAWLGAALVCAGGGRRAPRGGALERLLAMTIEGADAVATLAGARIACEAGRVTVAREIGDARSGRPQILDVVPGVPAVWDGRFEIIAAEAGLKVRPLAGAMSRLSPPERHAALQAHALARPALPLIERRDGSVFLPGQDGENGVAAASLVKARLDAACGGIDHETAIVTWRTRREHPKFAA
ncbi:MAG TPA: tRNA lysidine(34) synthetase TilS [Caulobacteraceae bacterium]|jgi:tRNA(Ile)-lysidine synthase|nr:tRNA lysidine(34) synthetase TilS [Caulobacteraceae bacterium]